LTVDEGIPPPPLLSKCPGGRAQELIANMLGMRREGVTEAAGRLQREGLLEYTRGRISVLDRPRLESRVCEYYAVVKREYDRRVPDRRKGGLRPGLALEFDRRR
jgi:hypothetical protein